VLLSLILAPIPVLAVLAATPVSSRNVTAAIEASGATFVLSSEREFFGDLPRLQKLTATGFSQLLLPESAFPLRPRPDEDTIVTAEAVDSGSWLALQSWILPAGTVVTWDHSLGANAGEYKLTLAAAAGRVLDVGLVHRIKLSRFRSTPEIHDYGTNSTMEVASSVALLELTLLFRHPGAVATPGFYVDSLELMRRGYNERGQPLAESTTLRARLDFGGPDTIALGATRLGLHRLHAAAIDDLRLIDRGLAFTVHGSVGGITIGANAVPFPSWLEHLIDERFLYVLVGVVAYLLTLVAVTLSWRTSHVRAQ